MREGAEMVLILSDPPSKPALTEIKTEEFIEWIHLESVAPMMMDKRGQLFPP